MVKCLFNGAITPPSIGRDPRNNMYGESGRFIEESIFGFVLVVEWLLKESANMDKIHRLIAEGEDGGTRVLSTSDPGAS
jgi:hypothetical protein